MISEDLELIKEIFSLIESGIVHGYDSFRYEVEVFDLYTAEELLVEKGGVSVTDAETDFDGVVLYELLKNLKVNSLRRGEAWSSFALSYTRGGQVKTKFKY